MSSSYQIDEIDQKILSFLVNNARMPFLEIARECGVSGAAIHQRVRKLESNGVYTADPKKDPKAKKYGSLKYETALEKRLKVMDSAAFALCMDNNIPIVVFDFFDPRALERVVKGDQVGTIVS